MKLRFSKQVCGPVWGFGQLTSLTASFYLAPRLLHNCDALVGASVEGRRSAELGTFKAATSAEVVRRAIFY